MDKVTMNYQAYRKKLAEWRQLAERFYCIRYQVGESEIPQDFVPADLASRCKRGALTHITRVTFRFLLHVWDPEVYRFELSDTIMWSDEQHKIFADWASGASLGEPCRYF